MLLGKCSKLYRDLAVMCVCIRIVFEDLDVLDKNVVALFIRAISTTECLPMIVDLDSRLCQHV